MISMRSSALPQLMSRAACVLLGAAAIALSVGNPGPAEAAVLQVSPVRLQFEPAQSAQALQVFNSGQDELEAQVRIMRWTQDNGEEKLVPATEVVASPAIMRVAPGQRQTVRIVRLQPSPPSQETAYRVLIDELPRKERPKGMGLQVLLRYSIPLFIDTTAAVKTAPTEPTVAKTDLRQVQAQIVRNAAGATELRVSNQGSQALRISALTASTSAGHSQAIEPGLLGYVLPGKQMAWKIKLPYPVPPGMTLKARFNDDTEAQAVPLDGTSR